jgi:hypothetical protein
LSNSGPFLILNTAFWAVLYLNQGLSFLGGLDDFMNGFMDAAIGGVINKTIDNITNLSFKYLIYL